VGLFQGREHGFVLGGRYGREDDAELAVELVDGDPLVAGQEGVQGQLQALEVLRVEAGDQYDLVGQITKAEIRQLGEASAAVDQQIVDGPARGGVGLRDSPVLQILPHLVGQAAVEGLAVALVRGAPARRDGCQDAVGPRRGAGDRMAAGIDEQQSAPILVLSLSVSVQVHFAQQPVGGGRKATCAASSRFGLSIIGCRAAIRSLMPKPLPSG